MSQVIEEAVRQILTEIGEDSEREGLVKTPDRVARAYRFLTKGYDEDPKTVINGALFVEDLLGDDHHARPRLLLAV